MCVQLNSQAQGQMSDGWSQWYGTGQPHDPETKPEIDRLDQPLQNLNKS
ncbi:hypothetical protein PVAP13_2NG624750 [Panicum virgatum]|uniref:Uncharacterized protein n=1 Tax=Panicum virgatum TaxID=38727 RepID=A0A8T0VV76_PANVG|nr:hypothetical protein PVAP13_2NG624750 [Panicum virgatum]